MARDLHLRITARGNVRLSKVLQHQKHAHQQNPAGYES